MEAPVIVLREVGIRRMRGGCGRGRIALHRSERRRCRRGGAARDEGRGTIVRGRGSCRRCAPVLLIKRHHSGQGIGVHRAAKAAIRRREMTGRGGGRGAGGAAGRDRRGAGVQRCLCPGSLCGIGISRGWDALPGRGRGTGGWDASARRRRRSAGGAHCSFGRGRGRGRCC